jgi:hypothetical protein
MTMDLREGLLMVGPFSCKILSVVYDSLCFKIIDLSDVCEREREADNDCIMLMPMAIYEPFMQSIRCLNPDLNYRAIMQIDSSNCEAS